MTRIERTASFLRAKLAENPAFAAHPERMAYRLEHSFRVASIGRDIARGEGFDEEAFVIACLLHDVSYAEPFQSQEDWKNHGRRAAQLARPFLQSLGLAPSVVQEICYGIAIHVDDEADLPGERTPFAVSVGDADNLDRFDAYRIYETLENLRFSGLPLPEKRAHVQGMRQKLERLAEMPPETPTAARLWGERIALYRAFYARLDAQLAMSGGPLEGAWS